MTAVSQIFKNWVVMSVLALFVSQAAMALGITNKSKYPLVVVVKDEEFEEISRVEVAPESTQHYFPPKDYNGFMQLETYLNTPDDPTGNPAFFHNMKPGDRICLPQSLCVKKLKKLKRI